MLQDSSMGKKDSAVKCLEVLSTCKPDHWKAILDAGISQLLLTPVSVPELLRSLQLLLREAPSFASVILSVIVGIVEIQQYKRKARGFHTFSCFGPHIWNSLPQDLRHCSALSSLKAKLKTFLFSQYFHPN